MHRLVRQVRFSVNPFLQEQIEGYNSYCSRPSGEGLALYFELSVGLVGETAEATGFVINVVEIDKAVREHVVPLFVERIKTEFERGTHIGLGQITELLRQSGKRLAGKFGKAMVSEIGLKLNPLRTAAIDCEDMKMIYFSEKFEFAATHKLWNDDYPAQKNIEFFGKCANPEGHGHNYVIEVTVKAQQGGDDLRIGDFEKVVEREFIEVVDHKNLNVDVEHFVRTIPSVENMAVFAWEKLNGGFGEAKLHSVTIWETDKTFCTYYG
jgi:6-pyruvoyltetrahydropterin/6-carboxytetrahydropterin synthase